MVRSLLLIALVACALCPSARSADKLSESECLELGFTGASSCTDCDTFGSMVKDDELLADCKRCCIEDEVSSRFTSAVLEVCPYRIGSFPQIKDFIDKHSASFKKQLSVRYENGMAPRLRMKGKGESETIRIDNWKAGSILEYLGSKLTKDVAA